MYAKNLSLFSFHPILTKCSTLWHIGGTLQIFIYFILERNLEGCPHFKCRLFICLMVILWHSVILVEETGRPGDNHRPVASHWQFSSHNVSHQALGFTTTYAISTYHQWCCEFESLSGLGVKHYVMKIVSDLRQVGGYLQVVRFPLPI
jgi:hypothetical protein